MNLEMEKNCEFQHHLNIYFDKPLDLDYENGFSFAFFE
jgi:hypothetical protein